MPAILRHLARFAATILLILVVGPPAALGAEKDASYLAALESITAGDLSRNVQQLADPAFDGREAGSHGGYAAADYLAAQLAKLHFQPAGVGNGYFQPFYPNYRNVLVMLPGSDSELKNQVILVGAHYDHLGHGLRRGRSTPRGPMYPGADDNASGTSGVLQLAQSFSLLAEPPKRSVLLAFWDAEEKGLLGSKYWTSHPTLALDHVTAMLNIDMIGHLRENRLMIFGSRSGYGWERLLCEQNRETNLLMEFCWPLRPIADHYPFYQHGIPVVMLHTGLHEAYHQPSDDASHINAEGMRRVVRMLFATAYELANRPDPPRFRPTSGQENEESQRQMVAADPSPVRPGDPPLRLGISWRLDDAEPGTIVVSHVVVGSPAAAAGLRVGDRIYQIGGRNFATDAVFVELVKTLPGPLELLVQRDGQLRVIAVRSPAEVGAVKRAA